MNKQKMRIKSHPNPANRREANYLVHVILDDEAQEIGSDAEQIWVQELKDNKFKICCIPFFVYGLALDDIVRVDENNFVVELLESSGRKCHRIYRAEGFPTESEELMNIALLGGTIERQSYELLAIDVIQCDAEKLESYLSELHGSEFCIWERGNESSFVSYKLKY